MTLVQPDSKSSWGLDIVALVPKRTQNLHGRIVIIVRPSQQLQHDASNASTSASENFRWQMAGTMPEVSRSDGYLS